MIGVEKTNLPISYTIPSGYVGSVSKGLRLENWSYALANSESIQGVIKINGNLYDISEKIMYQNPSQPIPSSYKGFNGDFYVPPGTVISLPDQPTEAYSHNSMYIIKIYKESSISFTSKIITSR